FSEDADGPVIGRIRLAVYEGKRSDALREIDCELTIARQQLRVRRMVKLKVLEAIAHLLAENGAELTRSLNEAIRLAGSNRLRRVFLDEGDLSIQLLERAYASGFADARGDDRHDHQQKDRDFIELLLSSAGVDYRRLAPAASSL